MWRHGLKCVSISTNIVQVLLGEHKYTTTSEANHLRMNIDQIKQYSGYDSSTTDEDFSMLKLKNAVDFSANPHIRPVCLPTDTSETYVGVTATVTGWGTKSSGGSLSSTLREVEVEVLSNSACR